MKRYFAAMLLLAAASLQAAEVYTFNLIPGDGKIAGVPGETIGWGYSIENLSTTYWLVATDLVSGVFLHGTPELVFDFPILAPGESVSVPFAPGGFAGLLALTLDASAPLLAIDSGVFQLGAEWWDGDPFTDGQFVTGALSITQPYSAQVVPEPATYSLFAAALAGLAAWRKFQRRA